MAVNAYLIIDGLAGPSTSKTGAIDILSFSVGASNTATYGTGASGLEAKPAGQISETSPLRRCSIRLRPPFLTTVALATSSRVSSSFTISLLEPSRRITIASTCRTR